MALVTWDQSYSVSVRRMDEQHQKLFALINALHDAMRQGKGQAAVQDTVCELATYTVTHFRAEGELLRKSNYPGLVARDMEHRKYVAKVKPTGRGPESRQDRQLDQRPGIPEGMAGGPYPAHGPLLRRPLERTGRAVRARYFISGRGHRQPGTAWPSSTRRGLERAGPSVWL